MLLAVILLYTDIYRRNKTFEVFILLNIEIIKCQPYTNSSGLWTCSRRYINKISSEQIIKKQHEVKTSGQ